MKVEWQIKKRKVACRLSCWIFTIIVFLSSLFFYFRDNKFFSFILAISLLFYHYLRSQKRYFCFSIDEQEITINKKKWSLENFKSFCLFKDNKFSLLLFPKSKFSLKLKIKLPPEKEKREKIYQILKEKLKEEESRQESFLDILEHSIGF